MLIQQCPPPRESNREQSQTQRTNRREFIPVGLLAIIRILVRRSNGDSSLITFGSAQEKAGGAA
jgi:hypothetical protein